jgi:hypothetical protein
VREREEGETLAPEEERVAFRTETLASSDEARAERG